jgi:hypothetical protein
MKNVTHTPGGGNVKIQTQKLKIEAKSKIGSLDNKKHTPGKLPAYISVKINNCGVLTNILNFNFE